MKDYYWAVADGDMELCDAIIELTNILEDKDKMESLSDGQKNTYYHQEWQLDDYVKETYKEDIASYMAKQGYSFSYDKKNGEIVHFWKKQM